MASMALTAEARRNMHAGAAEKRAGGSVAQSRSTWICPVCTFVNKADFLQCSMCSHVFSESCNAPTSVPTVTVATPVGGTNAPEERPSAPYPSLWANRNGQEQHVQSVSNALAAAASASSVQNVADWVLVSSPRSNVGSSDNLKQGGNADYEMESALRPQESAVDSNFIRQSSSDLAMEMGIDRRSAREILNDQIAYQDMQDQERRDAEEAKKFASVISKDCQGCYDVFDVQDMFTFDCKDAHRFCIPCAKRCVGPALEQQKLAACPMRCGHTVSTQEIVQLYGRGHKFVQVQESILLKNAMASNPEQFIACPKPGCEDYVLAEMPGAKERCVCPTCKFEFCSLCKQPFHYKLNCAEIGPATETWFNWINRDSAAFRRKLNKDRRIAQKKFSAAVKAAERRFKDLQRDEVWKEQHCRLCPHCNKVVYRVDGCSSMTCGRDAADKGGGNKQDGCGRSFSWNRAKKYKRGADRAHLPKSLADVDPEHAHDARHYIMRGAKNLPTERERQQYRLRCEVCEEYISGPRFSCIHCPGGMNICLGCEGQLTSGQRTAIGHTVEHVFMVYLEDSVLH